MVKTSNLNKTSNLKRGYFSLTTVNSKYCARMRRIPLFIEEKVISLLFIEEKVISLRSRLLAACNSIIIARY